MRKISFLSPIFCNNTWPVGTIWQYTINIGCQNFFSYDFQCESYLLHSPERETRGSFLGNPISIRSSCINKQSLPTNLSFLVCRAALLQLYPVRYPRRFRILIHLPNLCETFVWIVHLYLASWSLRVLLSRAFKNNTFFN